MLLAVDGLILNCAPPLLVRRRAKMAVRVHGDASTRGPPLPDQWLTLGGWCLIVPADFVMSRDMLRGVKQRAESLASASQAVTRERARFNSMETPSPAPAEPPTPSPDPSPPPEAALRRRPRKILRIGHQVVAVLTQPAGNPTGRTARHWGAKAGVEGCGGPTIACLCRLSNHSRTPGPLPSSSNS
jgi:hypothetical protein